MCALSETGKYVAIDLSGKNLRIMLLTLNGPGLEPTAVNTNFIVPNHVMKGTGDQVYFTAYFSLTFTLQRLRLLCVIFANAELTCISFLYSSL